MFSSASTARGPADVFEFSSASTARGPADVFSFSSASTARGPADVLPFSSASTARGPADVSLPTGPSADGVPDGAAVTPLRKHPTAPEDVFTGEPPIVVGALSEAHPSTMPAVDVPVRDRHEQHRDSFKTRCDEDLLQQPRRRLRCLRSLEKKQDNKISQLDVTVKLLAGHTYRIRQYLKMSATALESPEANATQARVSLQDLRTALDENKHLIKEAIDYLDTARSYKTTWNQMYDQEWIQRWVEKVQLAKKHPAGDRHYSRPVEGGAQSRMKDIEVLETSAGDLSDALHFALAAMMQQWSRAIDFIASLNKYEKAGAQFYHVRKSAVRDWLILLDQQLLSIGNMVYLLDEGKDVRDSLSLLVEREWNARWDMMTAASVLKHDDQYAGQPPTPQMDDEASEQSTPIPTLTSRLGALRGRLETIEGKQTAQLLTTKAVQANLEERIRELELLMFKW